MNLYAATTWDNLPSCSSWPEWRTCLCPLCGSIPNGPSQRGRWSTRPLSWSGSRWGRRAWWCRIKSATGTDVRRGRWAGLEAWCAGPRRRCTARPTACGLWRTSACHWSPAEHKDGSCSVWDTTREKPYKGRGLLTDCVASSSIPIFIRLASKYSRRLYMRRTDFQWGLYFNTRSCPLAIMSHFLHQIYQNYMHAKSAE